MPAISMDCNVMTTKIFIKYPNKQQPTYRTLLYFDLDSGRLLAVSNLAMIVVTEVRGGLPSPTPTGGIKLEENGANISHFWQLLGVLPLRNAFSPSKPRKKFWCRHCLFQRITPCRTRTKQRESELFAISVTYRTSISVTLMKKHSE